MDLHCILVATTCLYLTWICVVLVSTHVVSHLGHVSKCATESLWCLRSSDHWTFASRLYLVLSKYYTYHFPLSIILWGASMLHWNLVTIMLWDRYFLVFSNPSEFPYRNDRKKYPLAIFPCFELVMLLFHWQNMVLGKHRSWYMSKERFHRF